MDAGQSIQLETVLLPNDVHSLYYRQLSPKVLLGMQWRSTMDWLSPYHLQFRPRDSGEAQQPC